ncbi:MAG: AEC family transporter [Steroidobacteraceae bacterium]
MQMVWQFFVISSPLYGLVAAGYVIARLPWWRSAWTQYLSGFVFAVALPAMLFSMMSHRASLPAMAGRVLLAYFGSCLIVFFIGRALGAWAFRLNGADRSVFALGGIFSNIVLTGLPITRLTLGAAAVPAVALLVIFNALTLWTLVSVSVEWARHGSFSVRGFTATAGRVLRNPLIVAIIGGTAFGRLGFALPARLDVALATIGEIAVPAALLMLGMGLAAFRLQQQWLGSLAVCALKLLLQPAVVWLLAVSLGLPALELRALVLVASMSVGVNVYLMSLQFESIPDTIASSIVLSNLLAVITTPLLLAALHARS